MILTITSQDEIRQHFATIKAAAAHAIAAIKVAAPPEEALRKIKFDRAGFHPIDGRPLNLIEQINQTFTFIVALKAAAWLLDRHPNVGGFMLAPGAAALLQLDIMSIEPNIAGAETFAAVHPSNNNKLTRDVAKLKNSDFQYRYAFFHAPGFAGGRREELERVEGVEVHCIDCINI